MKKTLKLFFIIISFSFISHSSQAICQPTTNVDIEQVENIFKFLWTNMSDSLKENKNYSQSNNQLNYELMLGIDEDFDGVSVDKKKSFPPSGDMPAVVFIAASPSEFEGKNPMQIAIILAHEIAHLTGNMGGPSTYDNILNVHTTVEGEADYHSALIIQDVYKNHREEVKSLLICSSEFDVELEMLAFDALAGMHHGVNLAILTAHLMTLGSERADESTYINQLTSGVSPAVTETQSTWPSPQVRYETVLNALIGAPRPSAWAVPEDFQN